VSVTGAADNGPVGFLQLRRCWLLVVTLAAVGAAAAAAYSLTAAKQYDATATVVVAPVPPDDPALLGIDVLHDTQRRTAAETAARLIATPQIAETVRVRLGLRDSRSQVLDAIHTHVLGKSSAVAITARNEDPARAAQLANAYVDSFVEARTASFQSEIVSAVRRLGARVTALPAAQRTAPEGIRLQQRLGDLQALVGTADPTVRHGNEAVAPSSAAWPDPARWTLWGALIGLVAAVAAVGLGRRERVREPMAAQSYDPSVTEHILEQLEERLVKRVEELADAERRLAAREASLETREREVAAKIEQLRATGAAVLLEEEQRFAERETALEQREQTLAARERELAEREQAVAAAPSGEFNDAESEQALAERLRAVEERELAIVRRGAELKLLEGKLSEAEETLGRRAEELSAREAEFTRTPTPPLPPAPASTPTPPAVEETAAGASSAEPAEESLSGWRLDDLERLVETHAAAHPERADEWQSYLFYLRDYADASGRVPAQFDWLIEDAFGSLLSART
jgi:capsular polysaccharide biosynthesis protein